MIHRVEDVHGGGSDRSIMPKAIVRIRSAAVACELVVDHMREHFERLRARHRAAIDEQRRRRADAEAFSTADGFGDVLRVAARIDA